MHEVTDESIPVLQVEFCDVWTEVPPESRFSIGREATLSVDEENLHLHRKVVELFWQHSMWWLANVGSRLSVTIAEQNARVHAYLQPGARLPLVFEATTMRFSAGMTTYELGLHLENPPFASEQTQVDQDGSTTTLGRVALTPEQALLILALAEPVLRAYGAGSATLPTSAEAAARLGWTLTKFNRKLDNVCQKLKRAGVPGLHGEVDRLASTRRARLVEYAISVGLVTAADLSELDAAHD